MKYRSAPLFVVALCASMLFVPRASAQAGRCAADVDVGGDLTIDAALVGRIGLRPPELHGRADLDAAARLLASARARFEAGARVEALADLEAAWQRSGDVDLLGMLGLALAASGRGPDAWWALHRFEMEASGGAWAELSADVTAALRGLEAELGGVRLGGDLGAALGQVWVDGDLVTHLPFDGAIYLAPGAATLEIRAVGRLAATFDVSAQAGAVIDLSVSLGRVNASALADFGLSPPTLPGRAALDAGFRLAAGALARFEGGARAEVVADLSAAFEQTGDVDLLGALGLALHAAGRLPEAALALGRFRAEASGGAWARLRAEVEAALGGLQAQLGGVRIGGDFGARGEVRIDGRLVARLPLDGALYVSPGSVSLEVRGLGRVAQRLNVDATVGAVAELSAGLPTIASVLSPADLELPAVGASVGAVAAAPVGGLAFDPWLVVGVVGALTGVLAIVGGIATGIHEDLNANPMINTPGYDFTGTDMAGVFELVGWIGVGVGVAVVTTIAILAAVLGVAGDAAADLPDCDDLAVAPSPSFELTPWIGATLGGGAFELRF